MVRRKGELTAAGIDRGWPHQVIVPSLGVQVGRSRWPSKCERGHTVFVDGQTHGIHCFSDPADAADFCEVYRAFGAEPFDPRRRGRGSDWMKVKPKA